MLDSVLNLKPRDVPLRVALRNTAAVVAPLALGIATGHVQAGLAVTTGALNTMFSDQPGPYRLRMLRMLGAAMAAGFAALVGISVGPSTPLFVCATLVFSLVGGLLVALGPVAARIGLTSMIVMMITAEMHLPLQAALPVAGAILAGGLLQMLLAVAAWPLQRYRPERFAVASVLEQLAAAARSPSESSAPPPVSQAASDAVQLLHGEYRARGLAVQAFRVLADACERVRVALVTLGDIDLRLQDDAARKRVHAVGERAADVLQALARAMEYASPPLRAEALLPGYDGAVAALDATTIQTLAPRDRRLLRIAAARAQGLGGQLRALTRNAAMASSRGEIAAHATEARLPAALRPGHPLQVLRANLVLSSVAMRHALRCAVCLVSSVAVERTLQMPHGVWIPMTAAIVLKPDFGGTLRFGVLRTLGTFAGLLVGTLLIHFATDSDVLRLLLMALLCVGFRMFAQTNYALSVALLTGLLVLLFSFEGIAPGPALHMRLLGTVLGTALALIAYLLWPTWEGQRVDIGLANLIDAYRKHIGALLAGDRTTLHETRNASRAARTSVLASIERLRSEPKRSGGPASARRAESLLSNANRLIRAVIPIDALLIDSGALPQLPELRQFANDADAALVAIAESIRTGIAPRVASLRPAERALSARLLADGNDDPIATALADACDRIADAVDGLLHLLRNEQRPRTPESVGSRAR